MQLEMAVTGHISSVADDYYVRTLGSPVLMDAVRGSAHQLQELASELGALFLVCPSRLTTYPNLSANITFNPNIHNFFHIVTHSIIRN